MPIDSFQKVIDILSCLPCTVLLFALHITDTVTWAGAKTHSRHGCLLLLWSACRGASVVITCEC